MTELPDSLQALMEIAGQNLLRRDPNAAVEILRAAVPRGAVTLAAAWATLGLAVSQTAGETQAETEWGRALTVWDAAHAAGQADPAGTAEIEPIVAMLVHAGRTAEAVATAEAAVGPDDPRTVAALGTALNAAGDNTGAVSAFARSSAGWLAAGFSDRAVFDADLAAGLPGAGPDVALAVARALAGSGNAKVARERYDEAVTADPVLRAPAFEAELIRLQGDVADALNRADAVLATVPDDAEALWVRAQALRDLGRLPDALAAFDRLLEVDNSDRFRLVRASLQMAIGNGEKALSDLDSVGPLTADGPLAAVIRAEIYYNLGRCDDARNWFDRALLFEPGDPIVRGERIITMLMQGGSGAEKEIDALLAEPPDDPAVARWMSRQDPVRLRRVRAELLVLRGRLHIARMRYPQACADLTEAEEVIGNRPDVTGMLAQARLAVDGPEEALATIQAASPYIAALPDVQAVKATAYIQLDLYDEALAAVSTALDASPENLFYKRIRAVALLGLGRLDQAVADLADLAESLPDDADVQHMWGSALRDLGRNDEALDRLAHAEALGGGVAAFTDHASLLSSLHRPEEALEVLANAAARFPDAAEVFKLRAQLYADQQNYAEAAKALQSSIELDPDQPGATAILAEYLRLLGRYTEALRYLDQALAADPESYYALGTKGQVLRANGDNAAALALFRKAVDVAGDGVPAWLLDELVGALSSEGDPVALNEALGQLDRYLATGKREAWALAAKAETLRLLDRAAEGLEAADAALQAAHDAQQPEDRGILGTKAHLLVDLSRPDEALALADRLIAAAEADHQENTFATMARIRALIALDRHAEALADVDHYLSLDEGNAWALMVKARLLSEYREFKAAADILERLHVNDPFRSELLGYCRNRLADPSGAIAELKNVVAADGRAWWSWSELGDAYAVEDQPEAARQAYQTILREAGQPSASDGDLLINAAWAAERLGDPAAAVEFAQRALTVEPSSAQYRLLLGTLLLTVGRGLAAVSETEAGTVAAATLPDPRLGAAFVEEAAYDLERLARSGAFDGQDAETGKVRDLLHATAEHLRDRNAPPPPGELEG
jgi:tetratricopeptide (TPR) repeat protein